jgi:hypothetical protein
MFNDVKPITLTQPVQIDNQSGQSPFQINNTFSSPNGDTPSWANDPFSISNNGTPDNSATDPNQNNAKKSSPPRVVFMGQIQSGGGQKYKVQLDTGDTVDVTQMQISNSAAIPAGTFALVLKLADDSYVMQVPVWLGN